MTDQDGHRMTLGEHLDELRRCFMRAALAMALGTILCLIFGEQIMQIMCWPVAAVMRHRGMPVHLRVLAPAESFMTYMEVCVIWGLILSAPYALWHLWQFIATGLYPREKRLVTRYVPLSLGLFAVGVAFFMLIMAPVCLNFFIGFSQTSFPAPTWGDPLLRGGGMARAPTTQTAAAPATQPARLPVLAGDPPSPREGDIWINASDGRVRVFANGRIIIMEAAQTSFLAPDLTLEKYMNFVSRVALMFGLGFQVPIVVLVLAGTGLVSLEKMRRSRKYVLFIVVVVAAILTPPDMISQIALALPMYLLFELGLLLGARSIRRRLAEQALKDQESRSQDLPPPSRQLQR